MSVFTDLVAAGKIRSEDELRSLYKALLKKYHPDANPGSGHALDFDDLKREYAEARKRLAATQTDACDSAATALPPGPFVFDRARFYWEFRDLTARGIPINRRALRKNRAYRESMEYVDASLAWYYGGRITFTIFDEEMERLRDAIPRIYWYAMQVLWNSFDSWLKDIDYNERLKDMYLGLIRRPLAQLGLDRLAECLTDLCNGME
jgi:hypothetical protein